ncbi:MAG TPA: HupE/UreJ family protein [Polyangia bacterium]|nr:HupE/UreJ family protein [Polyangia bacterium]
MRNRPPKKPIGRRLRDPAVLLAAAIGLAAIAPERPAFAHAVGVSSGEYRLDGQVLYGDIGMAGRELARWLPEIDTDHDGAIAPEELAAGRTAVARALVGGLTVEADDKACTGSLDRAWVLEGEGGVVFQVRYSCPTVPRPLTLGMPLLDALAPRHRHLARVFRAGKAQTKVLDRAHATWTLDDARGTSSAAVMAWSMLKLGIEHILTGADHLAFLVGLILVGGRLRSLIGVVSAFTLAHSITLALAALSIFAPSPRLVEPAIALSIAYVGVENLFVKDTRHRWRISFVFGLIHGFGFAGALREIGLPHGQVPIALVSFNLGVEIGQLGVLSVALPLTLAARRAPWFGDRGVKALSLAIAIGGGMLFVVRLVAR